MASAAARALGITELLEGMLLPVDTKTLLLAQRVCKKWRDAIKGSRQIQRMLFYEPMALADMTAVNDKLEEMIKSISPLKHTPTPPLPEARKVLLNPLLANSFTLIANVNASQANACGLSHRHMLVTQPPAQSIELLFTFDRGDLSPRILQDKTLSRPAPMRAIDVDKLLDASGYKETVRAASRGGVTVGDILDVICKCHREVVDGKAVVCDLLSIEVEVGWAILRSSMGYLDFEGFEYNYPELFKKGQERTQSTEAVREYYYRLTR